MRRSALAILVLTASMGSAADRDRPVYTVTSMILAVESSSDVELQAEAADGRRRRLLDEGLDGRAEPLRFLDLGGMKMAIDGMAITFDGAPEPPPGRGVEVLSAPRITTPAGDEAVVVSGAAVQYFEPDEDGCYRLRTLPPESSPALRMALTLSPSTSPATVNLDMELRVSTLSSRRQLPGVSLDVGPPEEVSSLELRRYVELPTGAWVVLSGHRLVAAGTGPDTILLVLLRVDPR
jgi:hypothetical protein